LLFDYLFKVIFHERSKLNFLQPARTVIQSIVKIKPIFPFIKDNMRTIYEYCCINAYCKNKDYKIYIITIPQIGYLIPQPKGLYTSMIFTRSFNKAVFNRLICKAAWFLNKL